MNERDKVQELLKNYRSYKYAVSNGIAPFVDEDTLGMPMALDFGSRPPRLMGSRGSLVSSTTDFRKYDRAVRMISGAVEDVLDDDEREVVTLRWMERNTMTLERIAERKRVCERTVRTVHKRALNKLTLALRFVDVPDIHNLDIHLEKILV